MDPANGAPWTLVGGDCLDPLVGLASLAERSVEHIVTDPPYDEHSHNCGRRGATGYVEVNGGGSGGRCQMSRTRDLGFAHLSSEDMTAAAGHFARVVKRWVLVFCSLEMLSDWRDALEVAGLDYVRCGLWRKLQSTPQFTGDRPAAGAEAIVIAHPPGRKRWNGGGRHGVWDAPIVLNRGGASPRFHTTQKPVELMAALVADFTNAGDLICDPFAGSGTTGVAALRAGRRFLGWERDAKYAEVARRRLEETREQLRLPFERPQGPKVQQQLPILLGDEESA